MRLVGLLGLFVCIVASASEKKYPVNEIPEGLKKGMYGVIRERIVKIDIKDINEYTYSHRIVVTIFNKNAQYFAKESVTYDRLTKISYFRGAVYDSDGNLIKKMKSSDIEDHSYSTTATLFEDTRYKIASLEQTSYPYTVEFEYEQQNNFLYDFPDFDLHSDDEVSTQQASFQLFFNSKYPPRFKTSLVGEPIKALKEGIGSYIWNFKDIIPEKFEPYSGNKKRVPHILSAPSVFEYSGYRGDMSTWESFAKWKSDLLTGRDDLSEATKQKVIDLTKTLTNPEEKIKAIYEFVQNRTRYVNISLGIGGLQPFSAKVVDEVGYGDCKGLSNYTIALLKVIGIKGLYVTIRAGENEDDVIEDFPSHQSNHVIVAVPNERDTVWLECTSQTKAAGFMGKFTGNRKALINTPTGGKLVRTPVYIWPLNSQIRTANITLEATGDASATIQTTYSGLQSENNDVDYVVTLGGDKQKEWLENDIGIPNFDIRNFSFEQRKSETPSVILKTNLSLRKLAVVNGKRVFLAPNLLNKSNYVPKKVENRKNDVYMDQGYIDVDTVSYSIPEVLYPEFTPEPVIIKSRFGEYSANFMFSQSKLVYIRSLKFFGGVYPPESYNELIDFHKNINKADNTKVVFVNKT
jgi:hypothetical protein